MSVRSNELLSMVLFVVRGSVSGLAASLHCVAGTASVGCKTAHKCVVSSCW